MGFYHFIRKFIKPITNFIWPVKIVNQNKFVECKGIYVCNHYTMLDPVPLVTELFDFNFNALMKDETAHVPVLGKLLLKIGSIPVQREETDLRAIKKCMTVLRNNEPLVVFPEGTRNKSGSSEMLEFKEGVAMFALKTKAPIIPMVYYRPIKTFRKTFLLVGDPIYFDEFYDGKLNDGRSRVTEIVREKMESMQVELAELVKNKKKLKKLLREQKSEVKQIKKQHKKELKQYKLEYKQKLMLQAPKKEVEKNSTLND